LERPGDGPIAELADLQHGVVAYWQLIALGFTRNQIDRRERSGHLHRVHRGVYAVGRRKLALKGRWMGAVLAGGPDAVLSHHSAAVLWDLRPNPGAVIHVTAPGRTRHGHKGIKLHSVHELHPDDRRCLDGIPVTSVHRTLLDFAETARRHELGWAFDAASSPSGS
jgi:predicted transcriptional regulator of viral defense system